jgi:hypothetical protein
MNSWTSWIKKKKTNLTFLQSLNISKWQSEAINEEGQTIQWSKQRPKIEIMFIKTQHRNLEIE